MSGVRQRLEKMFCEVVRNQIMSSCKLSPDVAWSQGDFSERAMAIMREVHEDMAGRIVQAILDDLTDRRGLRQAWESIDDDIQGEIVETWRELVVKELEEKACE